MSRLRFLPDASDLAMLDRLWAGLASMVGVLVVLAASGGRMSAGRKLARVAESLARRVLFTEAMRCALPQVRPVTRALLRRFEALARRKRYDPCDVRYVPPRETMPRLSLVEALAGFSSIGPAPATIYRNGPAIRSLDVGPMLVRVLSTDPRRNPVADEPADDNRAQHALHRRLTALQAVLDHRPRHIARMGRWIARAQAISQRDGRGRRSPLRPGHAPGQSRRARSRTGDQALLSDAAFLAQRARDAAFATGPP